MKATNILHSIFLFLVMVKAGISVAQGTRSVAERFHDYNTELFQEKIFLHTDKEFYLSGEVVWFRAYLTDAYTNRPSRLSKIAYVELLDSQDKPVLQAKISMKEGEDHGSFLLPLTLNTGSYVLRAYTGWMKNSGSSVFFEKKLTIVNTLRSAGSLQDTVSNYNAGLYPEGGDLVSGLQSRIAFRVVDHSGKGVEGIPGSIIGDKGDTLARFISERNGNGSFELIPVAGRNYRVLFSIPGGDLIKQLPGIRDQGMVMRLSRMTDGQLKILIASNGQDKTVTLFIQAHHVPRFIKTVTLLNGRAELLLKETDMAEGISQVTVFDAHDQPVCERLFFRQPVSLVPAEIKTLRDNYGKKEKVDLSVQFPDILSKADPASLSLSVARVASYESPDIIAATWLSSELRDEVESPSQYFLKDDEETRKAADLLMLTQGWRRFKWEDVLRKPLVHFPLEYNGQVITGRLVNTNNDTAVTNQTVFLSVPGKQFRFTAARSDSLGNLAFETRDFYGASEVVVRTNNIADSFYRFFPYSPFSDAPSHVQDRSLEVTPALAGWLTGESVSMQVQQVYYPENLNSFTDQRRGDTLPFYGKTSAVYKLDDYTRFTTMEEVLREYVKEVNVIARNGKLHLKLFNDDVSSFFQEDVLVFIDGILLPDHDVLFHYDPLRVKKLSVVPRSYLLGPAVFAGIISLETYNGQYEGVADIDRQLVAIDYEGLLHQREFHAPLYDTEAALSSRLPDFRSTLSWMPEIRIRGNGPLSFNFYTSELAGRYMVLLQGLTDDGRPISGKCFFDVK